MKTYKEGDWMVTTPIIAGPADLVKVAQACEHKEFEEFTRSVEPNAKILTIAEKCKACKIAVRGRYRNATPEEVEEFKKKQAEAAEKNRRQST